MRGFLLAGLLGVLVAGSRVLAAGSGVTVLPFALRFAGLTSVVVTGDQDKFSDPVSLPEQTFNAASITLRLVSAGAPNIVPRLQLRSLIDPNDWTENHFDPIITYDDLAITAVGTYIYELRFPLVTGFRIRLDGEPGGAATTVSAVVALQ